LITRRRFLQTAGAFASMVGLAGAYGVAIEPYYRLRVTRYSLRPPNWPQGFKLTLAVVADVHACFPWMTADHVARISDLTNALGADCILLLGDYVASHRLQTPIADLEWARALARLHAPMGVHAVLGNHDWWVDPPGMRRAMEDPTHLPRPALAMAEVGLAPYHNSVKRLEKDGQGVWLAGLGDQMAFSWMRRGSPLPKGADDLKGTLAKISDAAPVILLAHEPDIFPNVPDRVALTLSGHTHGGQLNLFGWTPIVPSRFGARYVYGHIVESNRHLVVSGGLGTSGLPMRIGSPPEIVLIELG
jgi:hypothetical protein